MHWLYLLIHLWIFTCRRYSKTTIKIAVATSTAMSWGRLSMLLVNIHMWPRVLRSVSSGWELHVIRHNASVYFIWCSRGVDSVEWTTWYNEPVLRDYSHERPLVLKDQIFLAGSTFQCNWTCHQRPPVLRYHICMANGVVFQKYFPPVWLHSKQLLFEWTFLF